MNGQAISQEDWEVALRERDAPPADPAPPVEQVAPEPEPAPPQEEEVKTESFAALSPEVQAKLARLDELTAVMPQLVNELKEAKGRIGSLQSQWEKSRQSMAAQPTQTQVAAAAKDPQKWEDLKKDFPEWGEAIASFVDHKLGGLTQAPSGPSQEEIEQLVAQRTSTATAELHKKLNESLVTTAHRTWRQDVKQPDFAAWFQMQDATTKALANSQDPEDAITMLDRFYEHKKKSAPAVRDQRAQRLEAAATTTKPGTAGGAAKSFEDMTPREQWEFVAKQREKERGSA